jgi:hypothetical protein
MADEGKAFVSENLAPARGGVKFGPDVLDRDAIISLESGGPGFYHEWSAIRS